MIKQIPLVDLAAQYKSIKNEIDSAIKAVISDTAFIGGKYVKKFETDFAEFLNIQYCVSCANGTDSLEILLKAFDIGVGDEVIVPANSWISTSEAVSSVGATPVFVDCNPISYTIDTELIEEKITFKTKAIIPVHLYGLPAEMDRILLLAKQYSLYVIEDCAQAHGAIYKGKLVGTIGDAASFSFYPGKNLGAYGDAGCIVTFNELLANKVRMIANHGRLDKFEHIIEGRNSRMDGLQAAILSAKLPYLKKWIELRRYHAKSYTSLLADYGIKLPQSPTYSIHVYHLYVIQLPDREAMRKYLSDNGIETGIHYPVPLPFLKAYSEKKYTIDSFPISNNISDKILSLPMFPELTNDNLLFITKKIIKYLSCNIA